MNKTNMTSETTEVEQLEAWSTSRPSLVLVNSATNPSPKASDLPPELIERLNGTRPDFLVASRDELDRMGLVLAHDQLARFQSGVGKSLTSLALADIFQLNELPLNVLQIDSQARLSRALGREVTTIRVDAKLARRDPAAASHPCVMQATGHAVAISGWQFSTP